jgi:hypothetical protein
VEYVGTPRELVSASMAAGRRSWLGQLAGFLLLAAGVWLVATGSWLAAVPPIVFGVLLVSGALTAPAALFAWWRRRDLLRQPTRFVASADGVDYRTPLGSSHSAWPTFTRIRETGAFLFLETGLMVFYVPKRAFTTDDLAAFRRLVSEAGFSSDGRRTAMDGRFPIR